MERPRRILRKTERTPEQLAELRAEREEFARDRPSLDELIGSGDYDPPMPQGEFVELLQVAHALRKLREASGLTLSDLAGRTGIDQATLSRLETGVNANPSLQTIRRYASALGKRIRLVVEDAELAAAGPGRAEDVP